MAITETITIAGKSQSPLLARRFGYGTMRLTGAGIYGEPPNRAEALEILKQTTRSGINFLDTADYYGEDVTNRLIAEALYPYQEDLIICTKVGATRKSDKSWLPFDRPQDIRISIENNLRTLKLERLKLVHFRVMPGTTTPFTESIATMFELQREGKIEHVGVSNVHAAQLQDALDIGEIATVENMYGHSQRTTLRSAHGESRGGEEILSICEEQQIPLIPYFSLMNALPKKDSRITVVARKYGVTDIQINLAWLLHRSPWILPIPGTSSLQHFGENMQASDIKLTEEDMRYLD